MQSLRTTGKAMDLVRNYTLKKFSEHTVTHTTVGGRMPSEEILLPFIYVLKVCGSHSGKRKTLRAIVYRVIMCEN